MPDIKYLTVDGDGSEGILREAGLFLLATPASGCKTNTLPQMKRGFGGCFNNYWVNFGIRVELYGGQPKIKNCPRWDLNLEPWFLFTGTANPKIV